MPRICRRCSTDSARRGCRRNEASLKAACESGAMLAACRLAGLSALETDYVRVRGTSNFLVPTLAPRLERARELGNRLLLDDSR